MMLGPPANTEIQSVDPETPDPSIISKAAAIIRSGGLVAFPTETVYGLGADATNPSAINRIFTAKGRPTTNPLIVHCESVDRIRNTCVRSFPPIAQKLADIFWPGPLTLILPKSNKIPPEATAGLDFVGVRIPNNPIALALIAAADRPLAAPSANITNRLSPTKAIHVARDLGQRVDLILDAGPCSAGVESTVLDISGPNPIVLRPGPIDTHTLEHVLGIPVHLAHNILDHEKPHTSPGQSRIHYAPSKPLTFWLHSQPDRESLNKKTGLALLILGDPSFTCTFTNPEFDRHKNHLLAIHTPALTENSLYALLHDWDLDQSVHQIHVILQPDRPVHNWAAVCDRLARAATTIH